MRRLVLPALLALAPLVLTGCDEGSTGPQDVGGLAVVSGSRSAFVGRRLPVEPVIQLHSRDGDRLELAGVVVNATLSAGSLAGTTSVETDSRGRAVFTDLTIDGAEGEIELRFSCCSGPATVLSVVVELPQVQAGADLYPAP